MREKIYIPDVGYLLSANFKISDGNKFLITDSVKAELDKNRYNPKIAAFLDNISKMNVQILEASRASWLIKDIQNEIIEVAKSFEDKSTEMIVITTDLKFAKRCLEEGVEVNWRKAQGGK